MNGSTTSWIGTATAKNLSGQNWHEKGRRNWRRNYLETIFHKHVMLSGGALFSSPSINSGQAESRDCAPKSKHLATGSSISTREGLRLRSFIRLRRTNSF